ncbi:hypothetical protein VP01_4g10 [Puccinia sorghi]|uniref:Uncharacterized protein n=1 Tax=Puccinia sorghi TaxID=27349 RepID=A0A0L6UMG9_9BASI|nr:hypothetical protein VP01_4g10 [Puccinia sorghi]
MSQLTLMKGKTNSTLNNNQNNNNNNNRDQQDADQLDFHEPIWDQSTLNAIQLIESQYYNNNNLQTPKKKKLVHTLIKSSPTHLQIQVQQDNPLNLLLQQTLSQRFIRNFALREASYLAISDLVSCCQSLSQKKKKKKRIWCEFQVEYGLLGKRYLKPSQRPKSFISSSGVEIQVNSSLAISRQKTLDGGIKVHAKLEKEVAPEKVKVQVVSKVDVWGLKYVSLSPPFPPSSLEHYRQLELAPINGYDAFQHAQHRWGFLGGFLVQGIVDQIDVIPDHCEDTTTTINGRGGSGDQLTHGSSSDKNKTQGFSVRISDSKTTQGGSLPPPEYTESARYQLMLYKYLYDQHASGLFDVSKFASHLGLDLDEPFSGSFMDDAGPVLASIEETPGSHCTPTSLRGMFVLYGRTVKQLGVSQSTLEIVYRRRGTTRCQVSSQGNPVKRSKTSHAENREMENCVATSDAGVLRSVMMTEASLGEDAKSLAEVEPGPSSGQLKDRAHKTWPIGSSDTPPEAINTSLMTGSTTSLTGGSGCKTAAESDLVEAESIESVGSVGDMWDRESERLLEEEVLLADLGPSVSSFDSLKVIPPLSSGVVEEGVIGAYRFLFHPLEFSRFITRTIGLWNGDLAPIGVDIQNSNRCQ